MAGSGSSTVKHLVTGARVVVEWFHEETRHLGCKVNGLEDDIEFDLDLDAPRRIASIKLQVSVALGARRKTRCFFFIPPEQLSTFRCFRPGQTHGALSEFGASTSSNELLEIRLELKNPGFAVSPKDLTEIRPRSKTSAHVIERLRSLCTAKEIKLYIPITHMPSPNGLTTLRDLLKDGGLRSVPGELESLYRGTGGKRISWDTYRPENPPRYEDIADERPPPLTIDDHVSISSDAETEKASRKRRRSRTRDLEGRRERRDTQKRAQQHSTEDHDLRDRASQKQQQLSSEVHELRNTVSNLSARIAPQKDLTNLVESQQSSINELLNTVTTLVAQVNQQSNLPDLLASQQRSINDLLKQQASQEAHLNKLVEEAEQRVRTDLTARMDDKISKLRNDFHGEMHREIEGALNQMDDKIGQLRKDLCEDMQGEIEGALNQMDDEADVKIDNLRVELREKMEDDLKEEMENAKEEIKNDMRYASATITWE